MTSESFRREHQQLMPGLEKLKEAADLLFLAPVDAAREETAAIDVFLERHVIPHSEAEERVFYPAVDRVLGASVAADTMRRDHAEIAKLTNELNELRHGFSLEPLTDAQRHDLRRLLYAIHAILSLHFAKEEEIFAPLLEQRLSKADVDAVAREMEAVAAKLEAHTV
jgi:iron-sulfur cluster repair protein YtfE (RIC family)